MGNSLRCCLACVLPCGALDLIRIVHLNGHVDEISEPVTASEVLHAYPNHVLSKPCTDSVDAPRIRILSPHDQLKRGGIYFLIPDPASLQGSNSKKPRSTRSSKSKEEVDCERLFSEVVVVVPEKKSKSSRRSRRGRGRISSWAPHLESICED